MEDLNLDVEVLETKSETKHNTVELITTCIFVSVALVVYLMGYSTFLPLAVLVFGALWNFFTPINRLFAVACSFIVCVLYAYFAIEHGFFGQAFLHLMFYLPSQVIVYFNNRGKKFEINADKSLKLMEILFFVVCGLLMLVFGAYILSQIEEQQFPILDATSVAFLTVSVFLVNGCHKEYYMWRVFATAMGATLWLVSGIINGFENGVITMILLFVMYAVVDGYRGLKWMTDQIKTKEKTKNIETESSFVDIKKIKKASEIDAQNKIKKEQGKIELKNIKNDKLMSKKLPKTTKKY